MDLTRVARKHAQRCLNRFCGGISDPLVRLEAKRQGRYWLKAITGTRNIELIDREQALRVVQLATDCPPGSVQAAILAGIRPPQRKPTRRKCGPYKRLSNQCWLVDEEEVG